MSAYPDQTELVGQAKEQLATLQSQRNLPPPDTQQVYMLVYATHNPELEVKEKKKPVAKRTQQTLFLDDPPTTVDTSGPPPDNRFVLLRRVTRGRGRLTEYAWDLPQVPDNLLSPDVGDNRAVDRVVRPFLQSTLMGVIPALIPVPDEHLLRWPDSMPEPQVPTSAAIEAVGAERTMLVKHKIAKLDFLAKVRDEVAGVYRWWMLEDVKVGVPETLGREDRECVFHLANTEYFLDKYPAILKEARKQLGYGAEEDQGEGGGVAESRGEGGGRGGRGGRGCGRGRGRGRRGAGK